MIDRHNILDLLGGDKRKIYWCKSNFQTTKNHWYIGGRDC